MLSTAAISPSARMLLILHCPFLFFLLSLQKLFVLKAAVEENDWKLAGLPHAGWDRFRPGSGFQILPTTSVQTSQSLKVPYSTKGTTYTT